jgi:ribosome-associated heat shock protein Hsp15
VRLGKVLIKGEQLKPSKELRLGEKVEIKRGPILFEYQVLDFPKARLGAKMVELFIKEITSEEEKKKWLLLQEQLKLTRERGTGRPTKKDRREMDAFMDIFDLDEEME